MCGGTRITVWIRANARGARISNRYKDGWEPSWGSRGSQSLQFSSCNDWTGIRLSIRLSYVHGAWAVSHCWSPLLTSTGLAKIGKTAILTSVVTDPAGSRICTAEARSHHVLQFRGARRTGVHYLRKNMRAPDRALLYLRGTWAKYIPSTIQLIYINTVNTGLDVLDGHLRTDSYHHVHTRPFGSLPPRRMSIWFLRPCVLGVCYPLHPLA